MKLGYIGLGKMGLNMVLRLHEQGHEVVAYDASEEAWRHAEEQGVQVVSSLTKFIQALEPPRVVWIMIPHHCVDQLLFDLLPGMSGGDVLIDGGNSNYKDSMRRADEITQKGIRFMDVGVSGGPEGARNGVCLMIGGEKNDFEALRDLFVAIAAPEALGYMGTSGAGHFVKMVHNGIEYGMMQSIAEGFSLMKASDFNLNLTEVARVYNNQSVIASRLIGWLQKGFEHYGEELETISGSASASGEGEWTVKAAHELGISDIVIHESLKARTASQKKPSYQGKLVSVLRTMFGGHEVKREE
ncbi:MAG: 6-phosphogluconate dehydrogenase (decarboxylating) [Candidatus Harrisonbacteria bacterium CG10_big_fil_rev_8_21_14_0_10_42_17]|uniref:6-phosphogluconate dehydrogenase (Decarboxylating) n=1 Tax=Candidatus Harrisonbacteria bacterium CG10_big_fil_rev_8_21_14_0_10_42_17 TaxID=1974584 RepID=A0A2M6WHK8_9BACT|nr:MAG: 6-phosphogluconate dehydrogenase (decarboxylating) [Candidatus Harrisonbacteria bacterium CG10_big_fil_rev_8_21_14_0_10_42_17]